MFLFLLFSDTWASTVVVSVDMFVPWALSERCWITAPACLFGEEPALHARRQEPQGTGPVGIRQGVLWERWDAH